MRDKLLKKLKLQMARNKVDIPSVVVLLDVVGAWVVVDVVEVDVVAEISEWQ